MGDDPHKIQTAIGIDLKSKCQSSIPLKWDEMNDQVQISRRMGGLIFEF